jgi:hypothetical protein
MQVRHKSSPENGLQNTVTTDFSPRKARIQGSESSNQPSDLAGELRWWARHHNWYELDYIRNRLKLERAFAEPIRQTANLFMADRRGVLARQVKEDFTALLDLTEEFDRICRLGCNYEDEYKVCQDIRGRLEKMLSDLADLVEIKTTADTDAAENNPAVVNDSGGASENTHKPPKEDSKTEWVTYKVAAGLLGVRKSTVSKWVKKGRLTDNGKKGRKKRLSKTCVLLVKQEIDDEYLKNDADELRRDRRNFK